MPPAEETAKDDSSSSSIDNGAVAAAAPPQRSGSASTRVRPPRDSIGCKYELYEATTTFSEFTVSRGSLPDRQIRGGWRAGGYEISGVGPSSNFPFHSQIRNFRFGIPLSRLFRCGPHAKADSDNLRIVSSQKLEPKCPIHILPLTPSYRLFSPLDICRMP